MFIEGLRTDSLMIGSLRVSQVLAGLLFLASLIAWIVIRNKIRLSHDPEFLKLYVLTEEGQEVVAGTYYKRLKEEAAAEKSDEGCDCAEECTCDETCDCAEECTCDETCDCAEECTCDKNCGCAEECVCDCESAADTANKE